MCTTNRFGTLGYMAPEYINRGTITKELDIFSLGVIIIEIVTGLKIQELPRRYRSRRWIFPEIYRACT